jgi:outer membrane protein OmpA-like peptidoglycan-associated protein
MRRQFKSIGTVLAILALFYFTSCAHNVPVREIPDRTMEFEEGTKVLASNLADQLENSAVATSLNRVVINSLTKQKQLKKIVIDPFIDVESGYPVKANARIVEIVSQEITKRFQVTGEMEPDNLEVSEYVLNGMVTFEQKQGNVYKLYGSVFEKSSGKVLASASVRINKFDTTPKEIYQDSPVFLKGKGYENHVSAVKKAPNETVDKEYHDTLAIKSMQVKGDKLYEQKEYKQSLSYYNQAARSQNTENLEVLNGQFAILAKQGQWKAAAEVYARLLRASIAETNVITSTIQFGPNSRVPVKGETDRYNIYMEQIALFVASIPECQVTIVGHCSKTGVETYNDKLSLERASWIRKRMTACAPGIANKSTAVGRGFRENVSGTGKDDVTDQIDRRVEFRFKGCTE